MMTTLVTGGCGYIGSHLLYRMVEEALPFAVIDDLSSGFVDALPRNTRLAVGDVADQALIDTFRNEGTFDSCIHLAAKKSVPESMADPALYYTHNTSKTLSLLLAVRSLGVRHFIFSSTAAVYGTTPSFPVTEGFACDPLNAYGQSKLFAERILLDVGRTLGVRVVILRYFNVAGARVDGKAGNRGKASENLFNVIGRVLDGTLPYLPVFGDDYATRDGTCIRDFIHADDIASAHIMALNYLRAGGGSTIVNCGTSVGHSVREVLVEFERQLGSRIPNQVHPRRPGDAPFVVCDSTHAKRVMGWSPKQSSLSEIVRTELYWRTQHNA